MKKRIIGIVLVLLLVAIIVPVATALAHETLPLDYVVVLPDPAIVALGGTQQFTATGYNSDNVALPGVTFTWEVLVGGGTIDSSGLFTAGIATGSFIDTVKVTAFKNSISKSANATVIIVVPGPLHHAVISPDPATMRLGDTQQFAATGYDSDNVTIPGVTFTWQVVGGGGTINSSGLFTADNGTGTFVDTVKVTLAKNSIEKTAFATVIVKPIKERDRDKDRDRDGDGKIPYGWSHGEKKGWHGEKTPPGWSHGEKTGWDDENKPYGLLKHKTDQDDSDTDED